MVWQQRTDRPRLSQHSLFPAKLTLQGATRLSLPLKHLLAVQKIPQRSTKKETTRARNAMALHRLLPQR